MATNLTPAERRAQAIPIMETINALDLAALERLGAWSAIAALSERTELEQVDASPSSVVINEDHFEAIATVFVLLQFEETETEAGGSYSDEYLATVRGHLSDGEPLIDSFTVDLRGGDEASSEGEPDFSDDLLKNGGD